MTADWWLGALFGFCMVVFVVTVAFVTGRQR